MQNFLNLELQSMEQDHEKLLSGLESLILDTVSILKDKEDMLAAQSAGLLSEASLNLFANKANDYLTKVSPANIITVSGLESDFRGNKEAGLESVMNALRQGYAAFIAFLRKMYENITTLFADIYTKLRTSTKDLVKETKELKEIFKKEQPSTGHYVLTKETSEKIYTKFYAALGIGQNKIRWKDFDSLLKQIEEALLMSAEPKIPVINGVDAADGLKLTIEKQKLGAFEEAGVKLFKSELTKGNNEAIMKDKFDFPMDALFSAEIRILYVDGLGAEILLITDTGRLVIVNTTDDYSGSQILKNKNIDRNAQLTMVSGIVEFIDVGIIDKFDDAKGIIELLDTVEKVCEKISNNSIRNENNKRIDALKKTSKDMVKDINLAFDELEDTEFMKDKSQATRFQATMREVTDIWRMYPRINNESIKGLYKCIKTALDIVRAIKDDNKLELR